MAYSRRLTVTDGTSPLRLVGQRRPPARWADAQRRDRPAQRTPTAPGSFPFTVQVVDASGLAATKAVTIVIAATPTLAFAPAAGEVGVAYSQQPTVSGDTGPFGEYRPTFTVLGGFQPPISADHNLVSPWRVATTGRDDGDTVSGATWPM